MEGLKIGVVGLGLIGGSWALAMQELGHSCLGWDLNVEHRRIALDLGLIAEACPLEELARRCDMVILAVPANEIPKLCRQLLDFPGEATIVELGSVKNVFRELSEADISLDEHPKRDRLILAHPMAGTEHSGPQAALAGLFKGRKMLICDAELCSKQRLAAFEQLCRQIPMELERLGAEVHDQRLAYASHLSHALSFALALTVMEGANDPASIVHLSGSGFASTVRLAKSNPHMWVPIFTANHEALDKALGEYLEVIKTIREAVQRRDENQLRVLISRANGIAEWLPAANRS